MNKLITRAVLLEQFEDGMDVQNAIGRVISELGPEVINEKEAVEWYAKFIAGDTDTSDGFSPDDQFRFRNGSFLKWTRATVNEFNHLKGFSKVNKINTCSLLLAVSCANTYILLDTLHGIKKYIRFDWSNISHAEQRIWQLEPIRFLNDNHVFGAMQMVRAQGERYETTVFCGTLDFTTCTLKFNKLLKFEWELDWYTIEDKTKNQVVIVVLPYQPGPTQILTVNIKNGELTIVSQDTKNLVEFSLTDQTTQIHKIQKGEQFENISWLSSKHVWIDDVLLLGGSNGKTGTTTIYMFDLVALEWKKTNYEVNGYIRDMSTNDGNQLNIHARGSGGSYTFYQFQFKETDSLGNLIYKAVCRYSQGNQQFFQWFQNKLPESSKFRAT